MPFGQAPVLEVDGKMLAQSHTIARYLARKHGLAGANDWEQSQADMYVDCIYDLHGGEFIPYDVTIDSNSITELFVYQQWGHQRGKLILKNKKNSLTK